MLLAMGVSGLVVVGNRKRWGWLVCVATQPIWVVYALISVQYGFIVSAVILGTTYTRNFLAWGKPQNDLPQVPFMEYVDGHFWVALLPLADYASHRIFLATDNLRVRYVAPLAKAMGCSELAVLSRLRRGCRVAFYMSGEEVIGFCWASTGRETMYMFGKTILLGKGEAYLWNGWVHPKRRREGIQKSLLQALAHDLDSDGYKLILCEAPNSSNGFNRALASVGFHRLAAVKCLRVAGHSVWFKSRFNAQS
jgi:ribosomal protein S18 acetylase RimI-like enzyme